MSTVLGPGVWIAESQPGSYNGGTYPQVRSQASTASTGPDVRFLYRYAASRRPKLVPCWWTIVPFASWLIFTFLAIVTPARDFWVALAVLAFAAYAVLREPHVTYPRPQNECRRPL